MNKYILCAVDKSSTEEDLRKNVADAYDAAYDAADAYAGYAAAAYEAAPAAYEAAHAADAYAAAAGAYAADAANAEYWLNMYFERIGENIEDYEKAIKELEK